MTIGIGRIRHALGDGATAEQARRVRELLLREGLLDAPARAPELVGLSEIADLAGVTTPAVLKWPLPDPVATLRAGRVWDLAEVQPLIDARLGRRGAQ